MQNLTVSLNAPQNIQSGSGILRFIRFFKSELLKIFIFLVIFFASVFYANIQSKEYYNTNKSTIDNALVR